MKQGTSYCVVYTTQLTPLHGNFYENRFRARGVRGRLRDVEAFVVKMGEILDAEK